MLPDWPAFSFACGASTFHRPIIRACPPQEVLRTAYGDTWRGKQRLCEHALAGKLTLSAVCRNGKLHIPRNRVCPPQEVLRTAYEDTSCGKQRLCEYALAGKLTLSAVCRNDKLHIPRNRVCPPQESGTKKREVQLLLSRGQESGIFCRNLLYTA